MKAVLSHKCPFTVKQLKQCYVQYETKDMTIGATGETLYERAKRVLIDYGFFNTDGTYNQNPHAAIAKKSIELRKYILLRTKLKYEYNFDLDIS